MNKKIVALLLAATLTTGLGGFGTYAYFTDTDVLKDDVNITMGNLDVSAYWATEEYRDKWMATSNVTEVTSESASTLTFENAKPGDTFERVAIIANYGSLKADMTVQLNKDLPEGLKVELVNVDSQTGKVQVDPNYPDRWYENAVAPNGGFIIATVKVTIDPELGNDWMDHVFKSDAQDFILVGAHQTIN